MSTTTVSDTPDGLAAPRHDAPAHPDPAFVMVLYLVFMLLPIYWLFEDETSRPTGRSSGAFHCSWAAWSRRSTHYGKSDPDRSVLILGYVNSIIYVVMNTCAVRSPWLFACGLSRLQPATGSSWTSTCSFWLADPTGWRRRRSFACRSSSSIRPSGLLRHAYRGGAGAYAFQRAAGPGGFSEGFMRGRCQGDRPRRALYRRLFFRASFRE